MGSTTKPQKVFRPWQAAHSNCVDGDVPFLVAGEAVKRSASLPLERCGILPKQLHCTVAQSDGLGAPKKGLALRFPAAWTDCIARRDCSALNLEIFGTLRNAFTTHPSPSANLQSQGITERYRESDCSGDRDDECVM